MGNKAENILLALAYLNKQNVQVKRVSSFYQTQAWGNKNQDDFINAVAEVAFTGEPQDLLELVLSIESQIGRKRIQKWGPRLIDIDILEFNRKKIQEPGLNIPHPYYPKRLFVLIPFKELEPHWVPTGGIISVSTLIMNQEDGQELCIPINPDLL